MSSVFSFFDESDKKGQLCGGALIGPSTFLTAAHCVIKDGKMANSVRTTVGDYRLEESDVDEEQQIVGPDSVKINLEYLNDLSENDDFALITLPQPLESCAYWKARIASLPPTLDWLPRELELDHQFDQITDFEIANSECFATGWGVTQESDHSDVAQYMPVKLSPNTDGVKGTLIGQAVTDAMNICDGDSGNAVFCAIRSRIYLVGILIEQIGENSPEEDASTAEQCRDFDRFVVLDLRTQLSKIASLLPGGKVVEEIQTGQKMCGHL